MSLSYIKYYVRIYTKRENNESWQTLGPYDHDLAYKVMWEYLKRGFCCWVEDVEISE